MGGGEVISASQCQALIECINNVRNLSLEKRFYPPPKKKILEKIHFDQRLSLVIIDMFKDLYYNISQLKLSTLGVKLYFF